MLAFVVQVKIQSATNSQKKKKKTITHYAAKYELKFDAVDAIDVVKFDLIGVTTVETHSSLTTIDTIQLWWFST